MLLMNSSEIHSWILKSLILISSIKTFISNLHWVNTIWCLSLILLVKSTLNSILCHLIVWVETHKLRIRISFDLHIRSNIFENELSFTFVWTTCCVTRHCFLPLNNFISTKVAQIVYAAWADEHVVEVPQTNRTVVFVSVPELTILG